MRELGEPKEAARELFLNLLQESVEKDQDIVEEKAPVLKRKETFSGQDHSSCIPGSMCITGQPGTSGICFAVLCAVILTCCGM